MKYRTAPQRTSILIFFVELTEKALISAMMWWNSQTRTVKPVQTSIQNIVFDIVLSCSDVFKPQN